jgi:hypothetical protein
MVKIWNVLGTLLLAVIVLLSVMAVTMMIRFSPLATADSAAWVQAIGGLGAIWAALYIYAKQTATQNAAALVIAKLAAIRIVNDLAGASGQIRGAGMRINTFGTELNLSALEQIEQSKFWEPCRSEDIAMLVALPNKCAHNVAHGLAQLSAARQTIHIAINGTRLSRESRFKNVMLSAIALEMSANYFDIAIQEFKHHIDKSAPQSPKRQNTTPS